MERLRHFLFVRHGHNWLLLLRFAVVGFTGVFVNLLITIIANKLGPDEDNIFLGLPLTDYNVRWYHVFSTIAFLVANIWNFQLTGSTPSGARSTPAGCGSTCRSSRSASSARWSGWPS